jgi:hypothetical protein
MENKSKAPETRYVSKMAVFWYYFENDARVTRNWHENSLFSCWRFPWYRKRFFDLECKPNSHIFLFQMHPWLCLRSQERLHGNAKRLVDSEICLGTFLRPHHDGGFMKTGDGWSIVISASASRKDASWVFDHDSGFLETGDGWSISQNCLGVFPKAISRRQWYKL